MKPGRRLWILVLKDLRAEWRSGTSLGALGVYSLSTVYVCYRAFLSLPQTRLWVTLLWIIMVFSGAFMASGLFRHEAGQGRTFYYPLVRPWELYFSKIITAAGLQSLVLLWVFLAFSLFFGWPEGAAGWFIAAYWISGWAISSQFVFAAAVASKADPKGGLTAVLGLPIMLPALMLSLKTGFLAADGLTQGAFFQYLAALMVFCLLPAGLGAGLYSYLWHD
ncbi:MAG: hypothetical protein N2050_06525 [Flavobacteriales bacterium]|nr:hypothetical protein [Flavobacteriales bacterium]MCX7650192.1 hypothetical protein [Flavobacteriales bacterium]MDW8432629.1 hypothetical protein [Flavobacteriales bacterium]